LGAKCIEYVSAFDFLKRHHVGVEASEHGRDRVEFSSIEGSGTPLGPLTKAIAIELADHVRGRGIEEVANVVRGDAKHTRENIGLAGEHNVDVQVG
jgi:hypothetical protein